MFFIIRAFLGVYLAVCVCYSVVRGITSPAMAEDTEVLSEPVPQTTSEVIPTPEPELEILPEPESEILPEPTETPVPESPVTSASGEASYSGRSHGKHGGRARSSTEIYDYTVPAAETSAPVITSTPAQEEEPDSEEEEEDEEKQADDASAPAAIPTLEDYLRGLHCGGCGRNCFLLNPHCMSGARKESRAETAYYELYGEAAGDGI